MLKRPPDVLFLLALIALLSFGALMLTSASSVLGIDLHGDPYFFVRHQLLYGLLPGAVVFAITLILPYRLWRVAAVPGLLVVLVLLLLVFIPPFHLAYGGAARWVRIGPLSVQPAEFAKLAVVLYLAALLSARGPMVASARHALVPFLVIVGILGILIVNQPDIGTLMVITGAAILTYFIAGGRPIHLVGIVGGVLAVLFLLIHSAPYRLARFTTFLNPTLDPKGIGYQVQQALLAIGSGGVWGLGFGRSRQKFRYLPEPAGDSIFAIAAEELGFIRLSLLMFLYAFIIIRGYRIAQRAPDAFGRLLAAGITSWFLVQAVVHIAANLSLAPLTGIPLPFVSYGGSSLVIAMAGAGILLNISRSAGERST